MQLYYCILAYNDPQILLRSINKLNGPNTHFIIHIQKSVDISVFTDLKKISNVDFVNECDRIETIWGDISCCEAAVLLFKKAFEIHSANKEPAYCILMSGSDYPVKNKQYIYSYFKKNYPVDFYSFIPFDNIESGSYKTMVQNNLYNYWISYEGLKSKIEIKPFHYIRPRCWNGFSLKMVLDIPLFIRLFFKKKELPGFNWGISETWMELTMDTVENLLDMWNLNRVEYKNLGKFIHNPEEMFLPVLVHSIPQKVKNQPILVNTEARLFLNGSLNLSDDIPECEKYIKKCLQNPDILFSRKFSLKSVKLLNLIDTNLN